MEEVVLLHVSACQGGSREILWAFSLGVVRFQVCFKDLL